MVKYVPFFSFYAFANLAHNARTPGKPSYGRYLTDCVLVIRNNSCAHMIHRDTTHCRYGSFHSCVCALTAYTHRKLLKTATYWLRKGTCEYGLNAYFNTKRCYTQWSVQRITLGYLSKEVNCLTCTGQ